MRILVVHYNPAVPGRAGGAESAIRDQKQALESLGHEVRIEFRDPRKAYSEFQPDVIHFHTIHVQMGLGVLTWAQNWGIPHCLSLHDYWPFCVDRMLMLHGAREHSKRDEPCVAVEDFCDGRCSSGANTQATIDLVNGSPTVTFNEHSAEIFRRNGVKIDAVIPHAIDIDTFRPAPELGNGIITMSAWPTYNTKGMHVLRAALCKLGVKATLIAGIPRERVPDELRKGAIFVFPSTYQETFGLCLAEAMATGLTCIASDVAGSKGQITHGDNGFLFRNRDADDLADKLSMVLKNRTMQRYIGHRARRWAETNLTFERMARDYEAFYRRLIDG